MTWTMDPLRAAGAALHSPSAARNREPILAVLRRVLPRIGSVLEVASGTGEHAAFFAGGLPDLTWQPSDPEPEARASIAAHRAAAGLPNLLAPLDLDAGRPNWPVAGAEAVVAINMLHIAPWAAAKGLLRGAGRLLPSGGVLVLYGPFIEEGVATRPGNLAFDADLRERSPAWGLRSVAAIARRAAAQGLALAERVAMPADNLTLVFRRQRVDPPDEAV